EFRQAPLALEGAVEGWLAEMPALPVEDRVREQLAADRARDAESGGAHCGTHRSDLRVTHLARGLPAAQCSTGEQKALLISIVLAEARVQIESRGVAPILLLDEVVAHLDAIRRTALFAEILALGLQALLTGPEGGLFSQRGGRAHVLGVRDAVVTPARH